MENNNRFYVYALLDPTKIGEYVYGYLKFSYKPFYIGKGNGHRWKDHFNISSKNKTTHKQNTINKILSSGQKPIAHKILTELNELDAYEKEIEIIKIIGLENLTNICIGGEGRDSQSMIGEKNPMYGKKRPKELIEKMQKARSKTNVYDKKGKSLVEILGEEKAKIAKEKMSLKRSGKTWEEFYGKSEAETIREKRKSNGRKKHSEETKLKIKEKISTPELIQKRREIILRLREEKFTLLFENNKSQIIEFLQKGFKYSEIQKRTNLGRYMTKKIINKIYELHLC